MSVAKRLVLIADILGFRDRVMTRPPEEIVMTTLAYLRRALSFAVNGSTLQETPSLSSLEQNSQIGLAWFSDTVLLYARDDSDAVANTFMRAARYLAFVTTIPPNARLRAGIDYDELYVDDANRIYVGRALAAAYDLQAIQEWSGAALSDAAARRVATLPEGEYVISYPVPGKKGICSRFALDWTSGIHMPLRIMWSATQEEPTVEQAYSQPGVALKWRNTSRFHEDQCELCRLNRR